MVKLVLLLTLVVTTIVGLFGAGTPDNGECSLVFCVFADLVVFLNFKLSSCVFGSPGRVVLVVVSLNLARTVDDYCRRGRVLRTDNRGPGVLRAIRASVWGGGGRAVHYRAPQQVCFIHLFAFIADNGVNVGEARHFALHSVVVFVVWQFFFTFSFRPLRLYAGPRGL